MPVASLPSRKRVWTGDASESEEAGTGAALEHGPHQPLQHSPLAQPRKLFKRVHIAHPPPLPSSSALNPQLAADEPPQQPYPAQTANPQSASLPAPRPPSSPIASCPPFSSAPLSAPLSAPPTAAFPSSAAPLFSLPTAAAPRRAGGRKRSSASFDSSDGLVERSKRHNPRSSFSLPPSPSPSSSPSSSPFSFPFPSLSPPSPPSPSAPAPFAYDDGLPPLSDNNALLRSLHADRVSRRQQQQRTSPQQQQPTREARPAGSTAPSSTWPARPRMPAAGGEGDYCMMPLYGGRDGMFDGDSSWASSSDSSVASPLHSSLHSSPPQPRAAAVSWLSAATNMLDDAESSYLQPTSSSNELESMKDT